MRSWSSKNLLWALFLSLLINHSILLPAMYYLFFDHSQVDGPTIVEVELNPTSQKEVTLPDPLQPPHKISVPQRSHTKKIQRKKPKNKPRVKLLPKKRPEEKKKQPEPLEPPDPSMHLKMVEVSNPESLTPPKDAHYLSDKNRRVERETRARHTNLLKDHPHPMPSQANARPKIKPSEKTTSAAKQKQQDRDARQKKAAKRSQLLVMRQDQKAQAPRKKQDQLALEGKQGEVPLEQKEQRYQQEQKRTPLLALDYQSHDRIYGAAAAKAREKARKSASQKNNQTSKIKSKWKRIQSALENFIPEVQPGNQTALGTRAHPFALYIARMHRNIHALWGFGFLVDMDLKPDNHPMNDMSLWTMVEIVILPNGTVEKASIVKSSGILTYDVAALDTVFSASPYEPTPSAIRSADGKVYLHWRFHRNHRQCGTFGVDPYILTKPPTGPIDGDMSTVGRNDTERSFRRLNRPRSRSLSRTQGAQSRGAIEPNTPRAETSQPSASYTQAVPSSQSAERAVQTFIEGFVRGDSTKMASISKLPFLSHGRIVARSHQELQKLFKDLLVESPAPDPPRITLMSTMKARQKLGHLPEGADYGRNMHIGLGRLGKIPVTILLEKQGGKWMVVGLNRH